MAGRQQRRAREVDAGRHAKFGDYDLAAPWNNALLKDVVDATIWDPET